MVLIDKLNLNWPGLRSTENPNNVYGECNSLMNQLDVHHFIQSGSCCTNVVEAIEKIDDETKEVLK